jgi:hypothetical protein
MIEITSSQVMPVSHSLQPAHLQVLQVLLSPLPGFVSSMMMAPRRTTFFLLVLLVLGMRSTTARVTINMTAAAQTILATNAPSTVTTTTAPTADAVHQAAATTSNSIQKALGQLLSPNGTHKINITLPKMPGLQPRNVTVPKVLQKASDFSFNITMPKLPSFPSVGSNSSAIKKDTLKMATDVLQQLAQLQPSLTKLGALFNNLNLNAGASPTARSLLEDGELPTNDGAAASDEAPASDEALSGDDVSASDDTAASEDTTSDLAATMRALLGDDGTIGATSVGATKTAAEILNSRKIGQKVNLVMSDGWLVLYSGFKVAQASVQLLAAVLRAGTTGVVNVDPALLLTFADLGTNFSAAVGYLMYGVQKTTADTIAPFGITKPVKS